MILKLFSLIIILSLSTLYSQQSSEEKLAIMRNLIVLGLEEKGFEVGAELISLSDHKHVREQALFYLTEYHFTKSMIVRDKTKVLNDASIAYTYYLMLNKEYPNGSFAKTVSDRLVKLESVTETSIILQDLFNGYINEAKIVSGYIDLTTELYNTKSPNNIAFLLKDEVSNNAILNLDRYYDAIIVNYPRFEIYGYYWKFISNLSIIKGFEFFSDGVLEFKVKKIDLNYEGKYQFGGLKGKLKTWLNYLTGKYPKHTITLDLHLLMANVMVVANDGKANKEAQGYIEYVVQNEIDKTSIRYLLAKDFLLNNKFN